ncbi:MAG TPA: ATP-binding protein [Burkholderiaceae bacterium]|nr:ATP-binding protein [Burkholderiaceae bacterium]
MLTATGNAAAARGVGSYDREVQAELVRQLYRQVPGSMVANIVVAGILSYALWNIVPRGTLLAWLTVVVVVVVLRLAQAHAFLRRDIPPERMPFWARTSALGSSLIGLIWVLASLLFLDPKRPISLIAVTVIVMGISAGSVVNLASYLPSFLVVVGPAMLALIGVLLWHGDAITYTIALLSAVASIAYVVGARNVHRLLVGSLQLGFENVALRRDAEGKTALLEATLQNMRQGITLTDREGRLRTWNPQFAQLLGIARTAPTEGALLDASIAECEPPLELGGVSNVEYRRTDGTVVEIAQNAMPDGGRVTTYTDISELKRRESALELARRNAEQANAAKTRFLAAASHDLRQPIHALGLLIATLSDRVRNESTASILGQIDTAVDAIDFMLNSLLDISKLDAGVMQPQFAPVDLGALLEQLNTEYQPVASITGNSLTIRAAALYVRSDASMLHRILANLISNALRYTVDGRVLVGVRRRGEAIRLDVCDSGPGIPPESLDDIFLEFHQLGNPERDRRKGLGLGLAIVKRLAALLGHPIEVQSTLGRGSRFSLTVPLAVAGVSAVAAEVEPAWLGPTLRGQRVLVLDDDTAVLDAMRGLLERWGCDVATCTTPEEAEAQFASFGVPQLVIVDYRLRRNASGIETIGRLQQRSGRRVPALVITGDTAPDRLREAQRSGYPLLHKPVKPPQLHMVMRQILQASSPQ